MGKTILPLLIILSSLSAFAQRPKEIQLRAGYGLAAYKSDINFSYDLGGTKIAFDTTDGAATAHVPIEIRYDVTEMFNAGIDLKFGKYLYAPDDQEAGKTNKFTIIGIGGEFNVYNTDDARVFLGAGFNSGKLEISECKTSLLSAYTETSEWQGSGFKLSLGVLYFFGKSPVGLNLNFNYDQHNFDLKSFKRDGTSQDLTNFSGTLKVGGPEINLGIVIRLKKTT